MVAFFFSGSAPLSSHIFQNNRNSHFSVEIRNVFTLTAFIFNISHKKQEEQFWL